MSSQENFLELMTVEVTNYVPDQPIYTFYCPATWSSEIHKQSKTINYNLEFQLKLLGEELYELYPDLLSYSFKHAAIQGEIPMFVSCSPIDSKEIAEHFRRHARQIGKPMFFEGAIAEWMQDDIGNIRDHIYDWLPSYFARKFVESQPYFEVFDENGELIDQLKFFLVKRKPVGCMTESYSVKGKFFSYGVQFTIENFPNQPDRFFLFVRPVQHRFISDSLISSKQARFKAGTSILLRKNSSDLHPFISVPAHKDMNAKDGDPILKWKDSRTVEYLNLFLEREFSLDCLLLDPKQYISNNQDVTAYILYNPTTFGKRFDVVKSGLGLPERNRLYRLVHEILALPPSLTTQKKLFKRGQGYQLFPLKVNEPTQLDIQCHVSNEHFEKIHSVLIAKSDKNKNHISFGCEYLGDSSYKFQTKQHSLRVNLYHIPDSYVVREIDSKNPRESVDLIMKYIKACKKQFPRSSASIINIKGKDEWEYNETDPKEFVRYAFWKEGMISQFLVEDDGDNHSDLGHRVSSAILDLLKNFGVYSRNVQNNVQATWLFIRGNSLFGLPKVMVSRFKNNQIEFLLQDVGIGWESMRNLILQPSGLRKSLLCPKRKKEQIENEAIMFIEGVLKSELESSNSDVYAVFDRGSLSKMYKAVNNNNLTDGCWKFTDQRLLDNNQLKIIRITNPSHSGVPDYISYVVGKDENYSSGVFSLDERFYSLMPKGNQNQESPKREKSYFNKSLRQPGLLEFYPVGGHWDLTEKELAIKQLHFWRNASVSFQDGTIYPAPMHSLGTLRKYMDMYSLVNGFFESAKV